VNVSSISKDSGCDEIYTNRFIVLVDTPELCGGFTVWLTKGARTWLGGRYVSATWDAETLDGMKEEIVAGDKLKLKMVV
jgi:hypothetical protein